MENPIVIMKSQSIRYIMILRIMLLFMLPVLSFSWMATTTTLSFISSSSSSFMTSSRRSITATVVTTLMYATATKAVATKTNNVVDEGENDEIKLEWDVNKYQKQHNFVWEYGMESLYQLAKPKMGETILDLGCGTGELTNDFYQTIIQEYQDQQSNNDISTNNHTSNECTIPKTIIVGIDSDINMIQKATEQFPHIIFRHDDMRTFTFTKNTLQNNENTIPNKYDLIYSNAALHWIPTKNIHTVIEGISSSLSTGGRFVTEFGGYGNIQTIIDGCNYATNQLLLQSQKSNNQILSNITFPYYKQPWYFPKISEFTSVVEQYDMEVTFVELYDRPTPLIGDDGIEQWIRMFGLYKLIPLSILEHNNTTDDDNVLLSTFFSHVKEYVRPNLYDPLKQCWFGDYRRIRMVAIKKQRKEIIIF